jgi:SAM-dependent methyltransferase
LKPATWELRMLKKDFECCPVCDAPMHRCEQHKKGNTTNHPLYRPELPEQLIWLRCNACAHVFTQDYWTSEGERLVFAAALDYQLPGTQQTENLRNLWAPTVHRVADLLCQTRHRDAVFGATGARRPAWLDIGFGNGALVMTAEEFGFAAAGVDVRAQAVERLQSLQYRAICGDFASLEMHEPIAVLSMADALEHMHDPRAALRKAHSLLDSDGLIYISCPNSETCTWKQWERDGSNPYWGEIEHYHNFSRSKLFELLERHGFSTIDYFVSSRYYSCMEVVARKCRTL